MTNDTVDGQALKLFVGSFDFIHVEDKEEGAFTIVVEARDLDDAVAKCRTRLDELAKTTERLGPITVYANAFIEVGHVSLAKGLLIDFQEFGEEVTFRNYLPAQDKSGSKEHFLDGDEDEEADESKAEPPFWSGVEPYQAKWKLYWCETDDHDEDWFVVARNEDDAQEFHERMEGYDEDDASAELVCVSVLMRMEGELSVKIAGRGAQDDADGLTGGVPRMR